MAELKSIYKMELWEIKTVSSGIEIMRVPGGWVCMRYEEMKDIDGQWIWYLKTTTFIPFNDEFLGKEPT